MGNEAKKFKIPKSFTLFGHKYEVILSNDLFSTKSCYGLADDDTKKITIQVAAKAIKTLEGEDAEEFEITDEVVIETFYHEITHIILDAIGETKLSENEALVNMFGKAWLEIYLSSNYEKDSKEEV